MSVKNYIKHILYGYYFFRIIYAISPKFGASMIFKRFYNRPINWDDPKILQEKIYWLLFNTDTTLWTIGADKYRVREYVKKKGCGEILNDLYGHWDNPDDIIFDNLPSSFVLKANNGCHSVMVVNDKSKLNFDKVKKELKDWLKYPFGYNGSQLHYLKIKPCIIAEEMIEEKGLNKELSPSSLVDYKIWCFNGKPESIYVIFDRSDHGFKEIMYDLSWNNISKQVYNEKTPYAESFPKPKNLDKMIEYARILSEDFPEVRVEFLNKDGKIYFGELTFTAGYGDLKEEVYLAYGNKIDLKKYGKKN